MNINFKMEMFLELHICHFPWFGDIRLTKCITDRWPFHKTFCANYSSYVKYQFCLISQISLEIEVIFKLAVEMENINVFNPHK